MNPSPITLTHENGFWRGQFQAMASPCELLLDVGDESLARHLTQLAYDEAKRIERKFSRYTTDNIIHRINTAAGRPVEVDEESAGLLDFAHQCWQMSEGRFDITAGVLRRVWRFDGSDRLPAAAEIDALRPHIGWDKVTWRRPHLTLPAAMEIDLGGIGKEYAVDQTARLLSRQLDTGVLINYGGDLYALGPRRDGSPWEVGIDDPTATGERQLGGVPLTRGALTTSGDARRFLMKDGVRYSHILDPTTGWPVPAAPRAVTVIAATCLEAGMLSTFAMLQGREARAFLETQEVAFWCVE